MLVFLRKYLERNEVIMSVPTIERLLLSKLLTFGVLLFISQPAAAEIIAQTGFNDASGINGNATSNSPYSLGSLNGGGAGESGWLAPWSGSPTLTTVQNSVVFEGDQALRLQPTFSPSRALAAPVTDGFFTQQYVRFDEGARFVAYTELESHPEDIAFQGAIWQAFPDHTFRVIDGVRDGANAAPTEITGFTWSPGVWYQIDTRVDVSKGTWDFYVNGNHYDAPDPLGFRGNAVALDRFRFLSEGTGNVYLDGLTISAIPEPSSFIYSGLVGFAGMVYVAIRRRNGYAKFSV